MVGSIVRGGGARLLVLPVSAIFGIVTSRLVISDYGTAAFAQYGLLVGIGAMLPFTDLGMSAAVLNAVGASDDPRHDDAVRRTILSAVRILLVSAAAIALVAVAITAAGGWPTLLGGGLLPGSGPLVAFGCLLLIAAAVPVGVGQRVLTGLHRQHLTIVVLGLQSPVVVGLLALLVAGGVAFGSAVALLPYAVTAVLSGVCLVLAVRALRPALGDALRDVPHLRTRRGLPVFGTAWPMLILMLALPIAMQTDRVVLSHVAPTAQLAQYNLAAQMFTPIWAVTNAAGAALWPVYARARAQGRRTSPIPLAGWFGLGGAATAVLVAVVSPLLARLASGGAIRLSWPLVASFAVLMTLQAWKYPLGSFLTDPRNLRYQALMVALMVPVNLGLSILLAHPLGAAGPVLGSVVGVGVFELGANHLRVRAVLRRPVASP